MTARIGADGLDFFGDPRLELLTSVVRLKPEPGDKWVDIEARRDRPGRPGRPGFHSTQRLWISDCADGVAVATWPAEKGEQARYLYGRRLGPALVRAATDCGWTVKPSPHIAFYNSPPGSRLYMSPSIELRDYIAYWEDEGALRRVRYAREDVEGSLWKWLKQRGLADDGDDAELRRFLDEFLPRGMPADMRPGLRFHRVWPFAEADRLGPAIRSEFDAVFAHANEPALSSLVDA